jgi:putative SOS response-associated peptidase YedK
MCGRFVQNFTFETLQRNFNFSTVDTDAMPNYNVALTQEILTIIKHDNENKLERLHWGLVPFWAKDVAIGS